MAEMREENKCPRCNEVPGLLGCNSCKGSGINPSVLEAIRNGAFVTPDDGTHVVVPNLAYGAELKAIKAQETQEE